MIDQTDLSICVELVNDGVHPELLEALSTNILRTLDAVEIPAFIYDLSRRVKWQNRATTALLGDLRGKLDATIIAPEDLARARDAFARKRMGALHTEYEVRFVRDDGTRLRLAVSSVSLRRGRDMIGGFVLARPLAAAEPAVCAATQLTPRQRQALTLLAAGCSTSQLAELMGVSHETARNHVKRLLQRLDARSRLEAVAKARLENLI